MVGKFSSSEVFKSEADFVGVQRASRASEGRRKALEAAGLRVSGVSPDGSLVEVVELPDHPYFIACQFHPEFKSRPTAPHPLFVGLVTAALARKSSPARQKTTRRAPARAL